MVTTPSEVHHLHSSLTASLDRIDPALDQGDRREFVLWCKRYTSLRSRLHRALAKLVDS